MKRSLIRLLESLGGRELRRSEVEQVDNLVVSMQNEMGDVVDFIVEGIDGIEFDEKDGYQVQASSHSHD